MNNNYIALESKEDKQMSYMVFFVNGNRYAVETDNVVEVVNMPEMHFPSSLPRGIIGIFDYKGKLIKAVDLCPFLGFSTSEFSVNNRFIIVSGENDNIFAVHASAIENIVIPEYDEIQSVPYEKDDSIIDKIYKNHEFTVNIVNLQTLQHNISLNKSKQSCVDYVSLIPSDEKSKEIFKIRTEQNKKNSDLFSFSFNLNMSNQYVLFTLAENGYFLDLKHVKEFVSCQKLTPAKLPYTTDFIMGLINIKGQFLLTLDLKCLLNGEKSQMSQSSKIIVVEGKNFNLALLVDDVKYIKSINTDFLTVPDSEISKYIFSEFEEDGKLYSIINFDKIINDERIYINIDR